MIRAHELNENEAHKLQLLYRASGIKERYSAIADYKGGQNFTFFPNSDDLEPFPSTSKRNRFFAEEALALSVKAVKNCLPSGFDVSAISHLITVSCTGLYAPGLDIDLVNRLGLKSSVQRTGINFMGCYAAFNALKTANWICNSTEGAKVLVVCTELCSIHFQKTNTEDNLLANALFGDGSAAVLIESLPSEGLALKIKEFASDLLPNGINEMAWNIGDFGFEMKLSSYVPDVIKSGIGRLIADLKEIAEGFDLYAIHPGGKKILQVVERELGISRNANLSAHTVLRNFGNMSSPTILFVLKDLMGKMNISNKQDQILALAFGPGLTLESSVLEITHS